jgi:excinuclease ABC subunit C
MKRQYVNNLRLPDEPGVYIFKDYKKKPLYIGRATSLKDRVKSYFSNDLIRTRGPRIIDMITKAKTLSAQKTDSVLEAIILENNLIRKYQPHYNVDEKDDKSSQYVVITEEEWPRVFLTRARDFDEMQNSNILPYKVKAVFGPYPYGGLIKEALRILRRLFPFKDKKAYDARHDLFYRSIGRSPEKNAKVHYAKTIRYLILFFQCKKSLLRKKIEQDMAKQATAMKFEEANESKRLLYALDHINDIALIKEEKVNANDLGSTPEDTARADFRIEAYDVAHLSGTNVVGGMVVAINGELAPGEYRKFKIGRQENNDTAALAEMLLRRLNHTEWTYPDMIIVDGNEVHFKIAESILKSRRLNIPIVGVTKNDKHKADRLIGGDPLIKKHESVIVRLNAEAHRFTIAFHRKRRGKLE